MKHSLDITGFQLKIAAIIAMTCNHVAHVFGTMLPMPLNFALYAVGGVTFPIMAFLLMEGYVHTSDLRKYALRLLLFAIVAQIPYSLIFGAKGNVLFTLAIGLGILWLNGRFGTGVGLLATLACTFLLSSFLDWGTSGFVIIYLFGTLREAHKLRMQAPSQPPSIHNQLESEVERVSRETIELAQGSHLPFRSENESEGVSRETLETVGVEALAHSDTTKTTESVESTRIGLTKEERRTNVVTIIGTMVIPMLVTCFNGVRFANAFTLGYALVGYTVATILLCFYRGRRGRSMKWFFYAYYPLHLFAIWLVATILQ